MLQGKLKQLVYIKKENGKFREYIIDYFFVVAIKLYMSLALQVLDV